MKKTVLALVAVLGLGLVSCDRDERVLEVEKVVEKEVEKPSALIGKWKLVEASNSSGVIKDECITESAITFTETTYNVMLSEGTKGNCKTKERTGKYLYGEKLGLISLVPDTTGEKPGTYSVVLNNDKIILTLDKKDGTDVYTLTFQKSK